MHRVRFHPPAEAGSFQRAKAVSPLSQAIAGPLADRVFEPLVQNELALSRILPAWMGRGPGTGMGIQIGLAGLFAALVGLAGYLLPAVREAEPRMPDHDAVEWDKRPPKRRGREIQSKERRDC